MYEITREFRDQVGVVRKNMWRASQEEQRAGLDPLLKKLDAAAQKYADFQVRVRWLFWKADLINVTRDMEDTIEVLRTIAEKYRQYLEVVKVPVMCDERLKQPSEAIIVLVPI